MEIAAIVLGIVSVVITFVPVVRYIAFIVGILAIIFGIISMVKLKKEGKFSGMGLTGIITGSISLIILIVRVIVITFVLVATLIGIFAASDSLSTNSVNTYNKSKNNTITSSYVINNKKK